MQRFHIVFERGTAEQAHLRHIRRTQSRHAALSLDRFDHRRFFAADIGTRAAPQFNLGQRVFAGWIRGQRRQFRFENFTALMIFVAQINVACIDAGHLRRDQHAFDESMRIALKKVAILEGARLAFVDIHRHQAWRLLSAHNAPLASGGKTRAAETTKAGVFHLFDGRFGVAFAGNNIEISLVAALSLILRVGGVFRGQRTGLFFLDRVGDFFRRCMPKRVLPHAHRRRFRATPDAGCRQHTHILPQNAGQAFQ